MNLNPPLTEVSAFPYDFDKVHDHVGVMRSAFAFWAFVSCGVDYIQAPGKSPEKNLAAAYWKLALPIWISPCFVRSTQTRLLQASSASRTIHQLCHLPMTCPASSHRPTLVLFFIHWFLHKSGFAMPLFSRFFRKKPPVVSHFYNTRALTMIEHSQNITEPSSAGIFQGASNIVMNSPIMIDRPTFIQAFMDGRTGAYCTFFVI